MIPSRVATLSARKGFPLGWTKGLKPPFRKTSGSRQCRFRRRLQRVPSSPRVHAGHSGAALSPNSVSDETPNHCWDKLSRLDSAPALGTLSSEKMVPLFFPRRLRRGLHLDHCARLNGSQRLGAGGEVRLEIHHTTRTRTHDQRARPVGTTKKSMGGHLVHMIGQGGSPLLRKVASAAKIFATVDCATSIPNLSSSR